MTRIILFTTIFLASLSTAYGGMVVGEVPAQMSAGPATAGLAPSAGPPTAAPVSRQEGIPCTRMSEVKFQRKLRKDPSFTDPAVEAYESYVEKNTMDGYNEYLEACPDGSYKKDVLINMATLLNIADIGDTDSSTIKTDRKKQYMDLYHAHPGVLEYYPDDMKKVIQVGEKQLHLEKREYAIHEKRKSLNGFYAFLKKHPDSVLRESAMKEMVGIIANSGSKTKNVDLRDARRVKLYLALYDRYPEALDYFPEDAKPYVELWGAGPDGLKIRDIVKKVQSRKVPNKSIIGQIKTQHAEYREFVDKDLAVLKQLGIARPVVAAMVTSTKQAKQEREAARLAREVASKCGSLNTNFFELSDNLVEPAEESWYCRRKVESLQGWYKRVARDGSCYDHCRRRIDNSQDEVTACFNKATRWRSDGVSQLRDTLSEIKRLNCPGSDIAALTEMMNSVLPQSREVTKIDNTRLSYFQNNSQKLIDFGREHERQRDRALWQSFMNGMARGQEEIQSFDNNSRAYMQQLSAQKRMIEEQKRRYNERKLKAQKQQLANANSHTNYQNNTRGNQGTTNGQNKPADRRAGGSTRIPAPAPAKPKLKKKWLMVEEVAYCEKAKDKKRWSCAGQEHNLSIPDDTIKSALYYAGCSDAVESRRVPFTSPRTGKSGYVYFCENSYNKGHFHNQAQRHSMSGQVLQRRNIYLCDSYASSCRNIYKRNQGNVGWMLKEVGCDSAGNCK